MQPIDWGPMYMLIAEIATTAYEPPTSLRRSMRTFSLLIVILLLLLSPLCLPAQLRVFVTSSGHAVPLPTGRDQWVVMASVSLGRPDKPMTISRIVVTGTITPKPTVEDVSYELVFLVCDQSDCLGAIRSPIILWQDDWQTPVRLLASKSFGIEERHVEAGLLAKHGILSGVTNLYVAMAIKLLHGYPIVPGTATAELLRVEVVP